MILISSCLFGIPCRYDGKASSLAQPLRRHFPGSLVTSLVPVCPEVLGGLPVPRPASEITGGSGEDVLFKRARVISIEGKDVTDHYLKGAYLALTVGLLSGCQKAILKARSPACGCGHVYDGTFTGTLRPGDGVLASLLKLHGFEVFTEENLDSLFNPRLLL